MNRPTVRSTRRGRPAGGASLRHCEVSAINGPGYRPAAVNSEIAAAG
ncbi:hypothetical protein [Spirillospora sp. NPDC029432]